MASDATGRSELDFPETDFVPTSFRTGGAQRQLG